MYEGRKDGVTACDIKGQGNRNLNNGSNEIKNIWPRTGRYRKEYKKKRVRLVKKNNEIDDEREMTNRK
jgi:hypothetical protein